MFMYDINYTVYCIILYDSLVLVIISNTNHVKEHDVEYHVEHRNSHCTVYKCVTLILEQIISVPIVKYFDLVFDVM